MVDEAIPVLRVTDIARSLAWYERLGFVEEWTHRFDEGFPAFTAVARHQGARIFLSEHEGDATPDTLVYIRLTDVDAVAREFGVQVERQDWAREVALTDPDGNRLLPTPNPSPGRFVISDGICTAGSVRRRRWRWWRTRRWVTAGCDRNPDRRHVTAIAKHRALGSSGDGSIARFRTYVTGVSPTRLQ